MVVEKEETLCSRCKSKLVPPIYKCPSGHNCCEDCKDQSVCSVCGKAIGNERNLEMEQKARFVTYSCRWNEECSLQEIATNIRDHEASCPSRKYNCPVFRCSWWGLSYTLQDHFKSRHPHLEYHVANQVEKSGEREEFWHMQAFNELFTCRYSFDREGVEFGLWFGGLLNQARHFRCFVEFGADGKQRHPMVLKKFGPKFELEVSYGELNGCFSKGDYSYKVVIVKL